MSLKPIIRKSLGAVLNSPFLQAFGVGDVYEVLKDHFELSANEVTVAYQDSYAYAFSAIAAGLASDDSWHSFVLKVAQSRVESEFSNQVFSVYLQPFAEAEAWQAETLQQFRHKFMVNCRSLAEQKDYLFNLDEFSLSETELAALLQDCEISVLSQLLLKHLQSVAQIAETLNPSLVKFLAYKNLLGHALLFFLREQLRHNPRFERTLGALRQEGMLLDIQDFKQAQVELKTSLENKLNKIEKQLSAQNKRMLDASSQEELTEIWQHKQNLIEHEAMINQAIIQVPQRLETVYAEFNQFCDQFANWKVLLDSKLEDVIAALSNLQYVIDKIDHNVEMILAEIKGIASRIDVSNKIKARDEFNIYNSTTENQIREAMHKFKNLANYLDYPQVAMQLGSIVASLGDLKEAENLLLQIFETSKHDNDKALAAYNLFFIYLRQGSNYFDQALNFFNQAINLNRQAHILHNIDRYPIKSLLGVGGMGCVFLCEDNLKQDLVVVKCLWEIQSNDKAGDIFTEPLAMAKIAGDSVPMPLDYGYVDAAKQERAFFVTEFIEEAIDGEAWLAKHGKMDLATGAAVGIQIAQALQKAHQEGILHLDLKPANLLLKSSESGIEVKIIDFGLAKIATSLRQHAESKQRQSGLSQLAQKIFGTFDYAPPEQLGSMEYNLVTAKSDVFALGKTLYRFFSGKLPQHNIRKKYLPDADGLLELLEDCVEVNPEDRPDIATILESLETFLPKSKEKPKPKPIETPTIIPKIDLISLQIENSSDVVYSVAFSPDGKTILSGSWDNTMKCWDLSSGGVINSLEAHSSIVTSVAFSPDGKTALSSSEDNTVKWWDLSSNGRVIKSFESHSSAVNSVAFSPDGKAALSGSDDNTVKLWDLSNGSLIKSLEAHLDDIYSVTFSPDGNTALSGSLDKTIKWWDLASGKVIKSIEIHSDGVSSVAFSPDGTTALSGSGDGTIKLFTLSKKWWSFSNVRVLKSFKSHSSSVWSVAFSPDGKTALSGSWDNTIKLWHLSSGCLIKSLEAHSSTVTCVAFSPDGKTALSGSRDTTIRLWNIKTGEEILKMVSFEKGKEWVVMLPDGYYSASSNGEKYINVHIGDKVMGIEEHSEAKAYYNRPDLVEAALRSITH